MIKPFSYNELKARLRALTRRPEKVMPTKLVIDDLILDPAKHEVTRAGKRIELRPKEYALLEFLMRNADQALSRDTILEAVWGVQSANTSNRLEVYVRHLRNKIDVPFKKNLIQTVRSVGYKLAAS